VSFFTIRDGPAQGKAAATPHAARLYSLPVLYNTKYYMVASMTKTACTIACLLAALLLAACGRSNNLLLDASRRKRDRIAWW